MSAQHINGVSIGGDVNKGLTIVNKSYKPVLGFVIQGRTSSGETAMLRILDFDWLANGTAIKPDEERSVGPVMAFFGGFEKYEVKAVLFGDGMFYGTDLFSSDHGQLLIFEDFSSKMAAVRSMARDVQYSADRYAALEQHRGAYRPGRVPPSFSPDPNAYPRADMAHTVLKIREYKGDEEADKAITRLAALPDVTKGEPK